MGLFNRNSEPSERQIQKQEDFELERERIDELADHIFTDEKMKYVVAYDEDTLIYEHGRKHQEYTLDDTTAISYICGEGLMATRELAIWCQNMKDKKSGIHASYKIDGSISFSKKESDAFFHLFHDIKSCLDGQMIFFTPEKSFREIAFDDTDRVLKFDEGKKARFIRYEDIIGADLDTTTITIATEKEHLGRALVSGTYGDNGARGNQESNSETYVEYYDLVLYLEDASVVFVKKRYEEDEGSDIKEIFHLIAKIIEENGVVTEIDNPITAVEVVEEDVESEVVSELPQNDAGALPAPDAWTCECGAAGNTGKFCETCGKAKPEEDLDDDLEIIE